MRVRTSQLSGRFLKAGGTLLLSGEIHPTDVAAVLAPDRAGKRSGFPMRWGFSLPGRSLIVNARVETAAQRPAFREAWRRHRCAIPASWYYEWEHLTDQNGRRKVGTKYIIQPRNASMTWLAGIYRIEEGLPVFVVLTREPAENLRRIHDRMPLILPREAVDAWIDPGVNPEEILPHAVTDMVAERAD